MCVFSSYSVEQSVVNKRTKTAADDRLLLPTCHRHDKSCDMSIASGQCLQVGSDNKTADISSNSNLQCKCHHQGHKHSTHTSEGVDSSVFVISSTGPMENKVQVQEPNPDLLSERF